MTKAAITFGIILLLVSVIFVAPRVSDGQTSGAITQQWVDQQLTAWAPKSVSPVQFTVVDTRASYDNVEQSASTQAVLNAELGMLVSLGGQCVRIDVGYDAWLKGDTTTQGKITNVVNQLKSDGKCLVIADAAAESYRSSPLTWSQFTTAWVSRVQTLASLYHPDYYIVVKEIAWYSPMVAAGTFPTYDSQGVSQWETLIGQLASAVQAASPTTKIGVAVDAGGGWNRYPTFMSSLLTGAEQQAGVNFIGFDIYGTAGFSNTQNFLSTSGAGGKDVWIAECWSTSDITSVYDSARAQLDSGWARVVYYFAIMEKASMVVPFYTNALASYQMNTSLTDPSTIISLYSNREPVFYSFQQDINGSAIGPIITTTSSQVVSTTHSTVGTTPPPSTTTTSPPGSTGLFDRPLVWIAVIGVVLALALVYLAVGRKKR